MEKEKIIYKQYDKDNNLSYFKTYYKGTLHNSNITSKAKAVHRILQTNITSPLTYSFVEIDMNDDKFYNDISNYKVYFSCKSNSFTTFVEIEGYMFQLYKGSCGENDLIDAYNSSNNNVSKVIKLIYNIEQIKKAIKFYEELKYDNKRKELEAMYKITKSYLKRTNGYSDEDKFCILNYIDINVYKENKQNFIDYIGDNPFMFYDNKLNGKKTWILNLSLYKQSIKDLNIDDFIYYNKENVFTKEIFINKLNSLIKELDDIYNFSIDDKVRNFLN